MISHRRRETEYEPMHYSKYHLHRMFGEITGITLHEYVIRRQLTEDAKFLVFSERPVLDIAICCGRCSLLIPKFRSQDFYVKISSQVKSNFADTVFFLHFCHIGFVNIWKDSYAFFNWTK